MFSILNNIISSLNFENTFSLDKNKHLSWVLSRTFFRVKVKRMKKNDCFIDIKVRSILKTHFTNEKNLIQNDKRHISDKMMSIIRQK